MNALDAETWFCERLTVDDTGLIPLDRIAMERESGMSEAKIRQEFYCSFEAEDDNQLIPHDLVAAAVSREVNTSDWGEKIIGVDVARFGDDKSVIYFRQGRNGHPIPFERYSGWGTMQLAARVADWIGRWQADAVFVDEGGVGGGVVDRLHQLGFRMVQGVNFGARSDWGRTGEKASNKRSEMWLSAREWLKGGSLPDDPLLAAELTAPNYSYDANSQIVLERKDAMKKRGIPSPDTADAFVLTFAYPVLPEEEEENDHRSAFSGRNPVSGY